MVSGMESNERAVSTQVRLLWAASRKNNFEIYALEQKAFDAERRLKEVASQVEEVGSLCRNTILYFKVTFHYRVI